MAIRLLRSVVRAHLHTSPVATIMSRLLNAYINLYKYKYKYNTFEAHKAHINFTIIAK